MKTPTDAFYDLLYNAATMETPPKLKIGSDKVLKAIKQGYSQRGTRVP